MLLRLSLFLSLSFLKQYIWDSFLFLGFTGVWEHGDWRFFFEFCFPLSPGVVGGGGVRVVGVYW
jgi:hypothetical protein